VLCFQWEAATRRIWARFREGVPKTAHLRLRASGPREIKRGWLYGDSVVLPELRYVTFLGEEGFGRERKKLYAPFGAYMASHKLQMACRIYREGTSICTHIVHHITSNGSHIIEGEICTRAFYCYSSRLYATCKTTTNVVKQKTQKHKVMRRFPASLKK
jgi:hypothetical protein